MFAFQTAKAVADLWRRSIDPNNQLHLVGHALAPSACRAVLASHGSPLTFQDRTESGMASGGAFVMCCGRGKLGL